MWIAACLSMSLLACAPALAQSEPAEDYRWLTFSVFAAIIAITMYVTYLAAKRVRSASDFYTAGDRKSTRLNSSHCD
jgi:cation/acetate symporter